jgi:hypothetical protein
MVRGTGYATKRAVLMQMPGSSVMQVRVSGKFAFCEFRSIEETNLALVRGGKYLVIQPLIQPAIQLSIQLRTEGSSDRESACEFRSSPAQNKRR